MRTYRKVRRTKTEKELTEIKCNFCGQKIIHEFHSDAPKHVLRAHDAVSGGSFDVAFGYPSKFDLHNYEFDVCDKCFEKRFLPFIPRITNMSAWGERLSK